MTLFMLRDFSFRKYDKQIIFTNKKINLWQQIIFANKKIKFVIM